MYRLNRLCRSCVALGLAVALGTAALPARAVQPPEHTRGTFAADDLGYISENTEWGNRTYTTPWMYQSRLSEEARMQTRDAMLDEIQFEYTYRGYDLGFIPSEDAAIGFWDIGYLTVEQYYIYGGDNVPGCNPWGHEFRKWAAIVSPFAGTAFSITSPFGFLQQQQLLGNPFTYDGKVYQMTWNEVHAYDADKAIDEVTNSEMQSDVRRLTFPGVRQGEDVTKNTFRYAAARYNQAVKWDGKTLGIPDGDAVVGSHVLYQKFIGPDGDAYILGDRTAVDSADPDSPALAAFVVTGTELDAILVLNDDPAKAFELCGAPLEEQADSEGIRRFANGYLKEGDFQAYELEKAFADWAGRLIVEPIANETVYAVAAQAYINARSMYERLTPDAQAHVPEEMKNRLLTAQGMFEKYVADLKAAKLMEKRINRLPVIVELIREEDKAEIPAARLEYDALSPEAKGMMNPVTPTLLEAAERALQRYFNSMERAEELQAKLYNLPASMSKMDEDAAVQILIAMRQYNALDNFTQIHLEYAAVEQLSESKTLLEAYTSGMDEVSAFRLWLRALPSAAEEIDQTAQNDIAMSRRYYDALTPAERELVGDAAAYLMEAEAAEEAHSLTLQFGQIPGNYALQWGEMSLGEYLSGPYEAYILPLRRAYKKLSEAARGKIGAATLDGIQTVLSWTPAPVVKGDINKDDAVTILDVMGVCKLLAGKASGAQASKEELFRCDLDEDENITISDVMGICRILSQKE